MRSLAGGGIGWLRRILGRPTDEARADGPRRLETGPTLLAALEASLCEGVVHRPRRAASAALERRMHVMDEAGPPLQEEVGSGPAGSVAVATGMALAGLRATAFLEGDELIDAHPALRAAADRLAPLVVHAELGASGHAAYHAVADAGLFQVLASGPQAAVDLSLLARWLAERALVPGLVASDACAIEPVELPQGEALHAWLGRPDDRETSPTEGQRLLFGSERVRLLPWFDAERPVATGGPRGAREAARARLGARLFFQDHVAELAREGMTELGRLTGRPLDFLERSGLDDAKVVLVAQGASVQAARAVADELRRARGVRAGVVGVTWLRPLPLADLRETLGRLAERGAVAVLEAADPGAAEAPLHRELCAALGARGWTSARFSGATPAPERIAGLCELLARADRPDVVRLDSAPIAAETGFPRRDALLQALANGYPGLGADAALGGELSAPLALGDPAEGRSVGLLGAEATLPPDSPRLLAEALAADVGACVRGSVSSPEPGTREVRLRAAPGDFADPGGAAPVSLLLLLLAGASPRELGHALEGVSPGGTVLLASAGEPAEIWATFPAAWRRRVRERELRLLVADESFETALRVLRSCLRGEEETLLTDGALRPLDWRALPTDDASDRELPALVRRIGGLRPEHDSLPRFWGEVAQPHQGGASDGLPDPLSATGVVPAGASALEPGPASAPLPELDPTACTGCGRCWTACPDAAIGVSVLGIEPLLDAASRAAGRQGKAADALRRGHRHLAPQLALRVSGSDAHQLTAEASREAFEWLLERMKIDEAERPDYQAAFDATLEAATRVPLVATRLFFEEAERQKQGGGELLAFALDPRACLGCGLCVAECPEDALQLRERDSERAARLAAGWHAWEQLPDTAGATLQRAAENPEVGPLAASLLSRHVSQAQVGSGAGDPGCGERLAARLVTAAVERHTQERSAALLQTLEERRGTLEEKVRAQLAESFSSTDSATLSEALTGAKRGRGSLAELGQRLDELGAPARFDRRAALRLTHWIGELAAYAERLTQGPDGLGRARFGVVVAEGSTADWAARFPRHPWFAPLTVAPTLEGVELARGLAHGLVAEHVALVRALREAEVEAQAPSDRPARLEQIRALRWEDLEPEERASCPPLLLLADDSALLERGFDALGRLLDGALPIKVVLLDGRGQLEGAPEPALVAMAHRRAWVLAGSIAHGEHLAQGLADALAWPGPALIHMHAPSPARHGFAPDVTLERARSAVEGRAHVLFRYDPGAEGLFGLRASLEGNPEPEADSGGTGFAAFAAGEARFADRFLTPDAEGDTALDAWLKLDAAARRSKVPFVEIAGERRALGAALAQACAERQAVWGTLRELVGDAGPFTERVRGALERELRAEHEQELATLRGEHAAQLEQLRTGADQEAVQRLRERLMTLAGYGKTRPEGDGT